MAKFYAITAGVGAAMWSAVFALVVGSIIGLFYYLRIIIVMSLPVDHVSIGDAGVVPWASSATLAVLTFMLIWLGIYPAPLVSFIRLTAFHIVNG